MDSAGFSFLKSAKLSIQPAMVYAKETMGKATIVPTYIITRKAVNLTIFRKK